MQTEPPPALATLGTVSEQLGQPIHRIAYILRTRKHIQPTATAGRLRLFSQGTIELIKAELETIDSKGAPSNG
jgi:hypothetical protein